jgi:hypothetical protein
MYAPAASSGKYLDRLNGPTGNEKPCPENTDGNAGRDIRRMMYVDEYPGYGDEKSVCQRHKSIAGMI